MIARMIPFGLIGIALSVSSAGNAETNEIKFDIGNKFLNNCGPVSQLADQKLPNNTLIAGICFGYINGINDYMAYLIDAEYCLPEGVSRQQGMDIFIKFLRNNPEIRNRPTPELLVLAYRAAFPCDAPDN